MWLVLMIRIKIGISVIVGNVWLKLSRICVEIFIFGVMLMIKFSGIVSNVVVIMLVSVFLSVS